MNIKTTHWIIMVCVFLSHSTMVIADSSGNYLLREGDTIRISVWGDDTLTQETRVLPDGSISFPLVGRVEVAGWPSSAVENIITGKLRNYLNEPVVTVIVTGTEGSRVFMVGRINTPGPIQLTGPLTVLQAISIAGGFDRFADSDAIKILRRTKEGYKVLPVDYSSLLKGDELNTNYILKPDDTVLVP